MAAASKSNWPVNFAVKSITVKRRQRQRNTTENLHAWGRRTTQPSCPSCWVNAALFLSFLGQPRHCICTNASRGLSATSEFFKPMIFFRNSPKVLLLWAQMVIQQLNRIRWIITGSNVAYAFHWLNDHTLDPLDRWMMP